MAIRDAMLVAEGETKPKSIYMEGCALHGFAVEHISAFGMNLIRVISLRILRWDAITQYKSLSVVERVFWATNQVTWNWL